MKQWYLELRHLGVYEHAVNPKTELSFSENVFIKTIFARLKK